MLEDLNKLRDNMKERNKWNQFRKKLAFFAYHRVQSYIEYEAKERGVPVLKVNPKGTSSRCPVCGAKLRMLKNRMVVCPKCGYIGDRDVTACLNLAGRGGEIPKMWVRLESHPNAPEGMKPQFR